MSALSGILFAHQVFVTVSGNGKYTLQLFAEGEQILDETYYNTRGNTYSIELKDVISEYIKPVLPDVGTLLTLQPAAGTKFEIHDETGISSFRVIGKKADIPEQQIPDFLARNFLTYDRSLRLLAKDTPCYLTFYSQEDSRVKINAVRPDGSSVFRTFPVSPDNVYTVNVTPCLVQQIFGDDINCYQVWIESVTGRRISEIIEIQISELPDTAEIYLYENGMGGFDTLVCTGNFTDSHNLKTQVNTIAGRYIESNPEHEYSYKQNSGYLTPEKEICFHEFLESSQRFHVVNGIPRPIVLTEVKSEFKARNLNAAEFKFQYEIKRYDILREIPEIVLPLPPFPEKLIYCIDQVNGGALYERMTKHLVPFKNNGIDFSLLTGDTVFDRSGEEWKSLDVSDGNYCWPVYNFDFAFMKEHAAGDILKRFFFHKAISGNPRTVYPILVYSSLSPDEIITVEDYLGLPHDRYQDSETDNSAPCSLRVGISFIANDYTEVSLQDNQTYACIGEANEQD